MTHLCRLFPEGDAAWRAIVGAVADALIEAEEAGVSAANVKAMRASGNWDVRLLLGAIPGGGKALDLDDDWAARVVAAGGNYGELFERDIGQQSPLLLARGRNAL